MAASVPASLVLFVLPVQVVRVGPQSREHVPMAHTVPAGQARPQAPQWARSVCRSTQRPLHAVCLPGQESWQVPLMHSSAGAHV